MKKADKSDFDLDDVSDDPKKGSRSCKILLLFSEDGVTASEMAISLSEQVTVDVSSILLDTVEQCVDINSRWLLTSQYI